MATPPDFVAGNVLTAAQMNAIGLWKVAETQYSSATTVTLDNAFTSAYERYRIVVRQTHSTTLTPSIRFRVAGTPTTTNYAFQFNQSSATTVTAGRNTAQSSLDVLGGPTAGPVFAWYDVYGIGMATTTVMLGQATAIYSGNLTVNSYAVAHQASTAFDGIEINASTGTITGDLWVYGYKD